MEILYKKHNITGTNEKSSDDKTKVFIEINHHILEDESPSNYLNDVSQRVIFRQKPFMMLRKLKETPQSPIHHPEGNAWNHTMMVVDEAAKVRMKSKDAKSFMWAALLHDIGKPDTTKIRKGKITAYDHDIVGAELADEFLRCFTQNEEFIQKVVRLIRWHMQILYVLKDMPFSRMTEMSEQVDSHEIAMLGLCDRLGRANADARKEEENIRLFLDKIKKRKQSKE